MLVGRARTGAEQTRPWVCPKDGVEGRVGRELDDHFVALPQCTHKYEARGVAAGVTDSQGYFERDIPC